MTTFDLSQMAAFAATLGTIVEGAYDDVDGVIKKGALNIKNEMIADVSKSRHFRGMARSISFEHENTGDLVRRVIGPDKALRGGALGNIYYFGTSRGGGSGDLEKPLRTEEPKTRDALLKLADKWAAQL